MSREVRPFVGEEGEGILSNLAHFDVKILAQNIFQRSQQVESARYLVCFKTKRQGRNRAYPDNIGQHLDNNRIGGILLGDRPAHISQEKS